MVVVSVGESMLRQVKNGARVIDAKTGAKWRESD